MALNIIEITTKLRSNQPATAKLSVVTQDMTTIHSFLSSSNSPPLKALGDKEFNLVEFTEQYLSLLLGIKVNMIITNEVVEFIPG